MKKLTPIGLGVGLAGLSLFLSACGGESSGGNASTPAPIANRAPSVSLQGVPTQVREGESISFSLSGSDPDGDSLIYTLATIQGPDLGLS